MHRPLALPLLLAGLLVPATAAAADPDTADPDTAEPEAGDDRPTPGGWTEVDAEGRPVDDGTADGLRWKDGPVQARALTDATAYTIPRGTFRVGPFKQSWGALDNWEIGTSAGSFLLGLPNVHSKVTAIQTPAVEASFRAGYTYMDLGPLLQTEGVSASWIPLRATVSWRADDAVGLHVGASWSTLSLDGGVSPEQLAQGLALASGVSLDEATLDVLADMGEDVQLYGEADIVLTQSHLAFDYQLNRRDSLIFQATTLTSLSGRVIGGVESTDDGSGASTQVGTTARIHVPLKDAVSVLASVSWRFSWERMHLRVGLPVPIGNTWYAAVPQAFSLHWVLGARKAAARQAARDQRRLTD